MPKFVEAPAGIEGKTAWAGFDLSQVVAWVFVPKSTVNPVAKLLVWFACWPLLRENMRTGHMTYDGEAANLLANTLSDLARPTHVED